MPQEFISSSEQETFDLGKKISSLMRPGDIFLLEGELGSGKSVFARGAASGLGVTEPMPSPTFTIINEYIAEHKIYHFDFYRINDPFELFEIGFEDYIYSDGISLIEWPSKAGDLLPDDAVKVRIEIVDGKRKITVGWDR